MWISRGDLRLKYVTREDYNAGISATSKDRSALTDLVIHLAEHCGIMRGYKEDALQTLRSTDGFYSGGYQAEVARVAVASMLRDLSVLKEVAAEDDARRQAAGVARRARERLGIAQKDKLTIELTKEDRDLLRSATDKKTKKDTK